MHGPRLRSPLIRGGCEMPCVWRALEVPIFLVIPRRFVALWPRAGIDLRVIVDRRLDFATHQDRQIRPVQPQRVARR